MAGLAARKSRGRVLQCSHLGKLLGSSQHAINVQPVPALGTPLAPARARGLVPPALLLCPGSSASACGLHHACLLQSHLRAFPAPSPMINVSICTWDSTLKCTCVYQQTVPLPPDNCLCIHACSEVLKTSHLQHLKGSGKEETGCLLFLRMLKAPPPCVASAQPDD